MPGGINTEFGVHYIAFGAVKLVGYSLYTFRLNKIYETEKSTFLVGTTRMLIGMFFGSIFGYFFFDAPWLFYFGLFPLRIIEWTLISILFYDPVLAHKNKLARNCTEGTVVSYILDIPAVLGFFVMGGFWIC